MNKKQLSAAQLHTKLRLSTPLQIKPNYKVEYYRFWEIRKFPRLTSESQEHCIVHDVYGNFILGQRGLKETKERLDQKYERYKKWKYQKTEGGTICWLKIKQKD